MKLDAQLIREATIAQLGMDAEPGASSSAPGARPRPLRVEGERVPLLDITDGSFTVPDDATRFRVQLSARTIAGMMVFIGYASPPSSTNASWILCDLEDWTEDVAAGTVVFFAIVNPDDMTALRGGDYDALYVSYYG